MGEKEFNADEYFRKQQEEVAGRKGRNKKVKPTEFTRPPITVRITSGSVQVADASMVDIKTHGTTKRPDAVTLGDE